MALTGFTFNSVHSSTYGVAKSIDIPIRPPVKTYTVDMPNANGVIDFTGANENIYYQDCVFSVELQIKADDIYKLKTKLKEVANWLTGSGILIFDDDPTQTYEASCYDGLSYIPEILGKFAKITINFRVKPWL